MTRRSDSTQPLDQQRDAPPVPVEQEGAGARSRLIHLAALAVALAAAALTLVAMARLGLASGQPRAMHWVNLADTPVRAPAAAGDPPPVVKPLLRIAIAPIVTPERALPQYQPLAAYLAGRLRRTPAPLYRSTCADVNELLRNGQCELALVCTYQMLRGERGFGLQVLAVPSFRGSVSTRSIILVPSSSSAASLSDLRGKRFAIPGLVSTSGWLYPAVWLRQHGFQPDGFFGELLSTGSHDRAIEAVAGGYADGAAASNAVCEALRAEDPALAARVKVIQESEPLGRPAFVVSPRLDPELREALQSLLLHAHEDPLAAPVLAALNTDRFVAPEAGQYDSVRKLAAAWEEDKP